MRDEPYLGRLLSQALRPRPRPRRRLRRRPWDEVPEKPGSWDEAPEDGR